MALVSAYTFLPGLEARAISATDQILCAGLETTGSTISIGTLNDADVVIGNANGSVSIAGGIEFAGSTFLLRSGQPNGGNGAIAVERGGTGLDFVGVWNEANSTFNVGLADTNQGSTPAIPSAGNFVDLNMGPTLSMDGDGGVSTFQATAGMSLSANAGTSPITLSGVPVNIVVGANSISIQNINPGIIPSTTDYNLGSDASRFGRAYLDTAVEIGSLEILQTAFDFDQNYQIGGSQNSGSSANLTILANSSTTPSNAGGDLSLSGGSSTSGIGGNVNIDGGNGSTNGQILLGKLNTTLIDIGLTTFNTIVRSQDGLNLQGANSSLIPVFSSSDPNGNSLTGFVATSLLGAIQENRSNISNTTNSSIYQASENIDIGAIVRVSGQSQCLLASNNSAASANAIGIAGETKLSGESIEIIRNGTSPVRMVAGLTIAPNQKVYLATGGLGTNVAPDPETTFKVFIGYTKNTTAYTGSLGDTVLVEIIGPCVFVGPS